MTKEDNITISNIS